MSASPPPPAPIAPIDWSAVPAELGRPGARVTFHNEYLPDVHWVTLQNDGAGAEHGAKAHQLVVFRDGHVDGERGPSALARYLRRARIEELPPAPGDRVVNLVVQFKALPPGFGQMLGYVDPTTGEDQPLPAVTVRAGAGPLRSTRHRPSRSPPVRARRRSCPSPPPVEGPPGAAMPPPRPARARLGADAGHRFTWTVERWDAAARAWAPERTIPLEP